MFVVHRSCFCHTGRHWYLNLLYHVILMSTLIRELEGKTFSIGVILPYTGTWPIGSKMAGAVAVAMERVNTDQMLSAVREGGHNFSFTWRDSQCLDNVGLPVVVELWAKEHVDAFIGKSFSILLTRLRCPEDYEKVQIEKA